MFFYVIKDEKSMFYTTDRITRTLLNKTRKSLQEKDKIFYKYYLDLDDKNTLYENESTNARIPFYTSFLEHKKGIDRFSALNSIKAPFEHTCRRGRYLFFSRSAVDSKYCLLAVDLFTSNTFVYPM